MLHFPSPSGLAGQQRVLVRLPPGLLVPLGGLHRILGLVNPPADDDDVAAALADHPVRGVVLLAERVARGRQADPGRQVDKVRLVDEPPLADEAHHVVAVVAGHLHGGLGVLAAGQRALGAHLGQEQQAAATWEAHLPEAGDDPGPRHGVRVHHVRPVRDAEDPVLVLVLHRVALRRERERKGEERKERERERKSEVFRNRR